MVVEDGPEVVVSRQGYAASVGWTSIECDLSRCVQRDLCYGPTTYRAVSMRSRAEQCLREPGGLRNTSAPLLLLMYDST